MNKIMNALKIKNGKMQGLNHLKNVMVASDKVIGTVMSNAYMKIVLGLVFLKYVLDRFAAKDNELNA